MRSRGSCAREEPTGASYSITPPSSNRVCATCAASLPVPRTDHMRAVLMPSARALAVTVKSSGAAGRRC